MTLPSPVPDPPLQLNDESSQREELVAEIRRLKEEKARAVEAQFFFFGSVLIVMDVDSRWVRKLGFECFW